ncbi:MAG: hypothetical protein Tsb006_3390 [Rickettsiaceae bacterium]
MDDFNPDKNLKKVTDVLSTLNTKSTPKDIARLFAESGGPLQELATIVSERWDYLYELQSNLVKVRLTLKSGDEWKITKKEIAEKTRGIKAELDQLKEFKEAYESLSNFVSASNRFGELDQEIQRFDRLKGSKSTLVQKVTSFFTKVIQSCKDLVGGKKVTIESLQESMRGDLGAIKAHTETLRQDNEQIAGKAKDYVEKLYDSRVESLQKILKQSFVEKFLSGRAETLQKNNTGRSTGGRSNGGRSV